MAHTHDQFYSDRQTVSLNCVDRYLYAHELKGGFSRTWERKPFRTAYTTILLVISGKLTICTDSDERTADAISIRMIPTWLGMTGIEYSQDFHGIVLEVCEDLMVDLFRNNNPLPIDFLYRLSEDGDFLRLDKEECTSLLADMRSLMSALGRKGHHYITELSYAHLYILVTDFADILWKRFGNGELSHPVNVRRQDIIMQQFTELLGRDIEKESSVSYYAEKLCISKQYLSMIVKEKTHNPIGKIISTMRAERGIRFLRGTGLSIKEIADRLSFPDQSSFGKFMKKYLGVSPSTYRSSLRKNFLPPESTALRNASEHEAPRLHQQTE